MSVTNSQVLGTSTAIGGVAFLPYTGNSSFLQFFQLILRASFILMVLLVIVQLFVRFLKHLMHQNNNNSLQKNLHERTSLGFFSTKVKVQISLLYFCLFFVVGFRWFQTHDIRTMFVSAQQNQSYESVSVPNTFRQGTPKKLIIPSVDLDISVVEGEYRNNTWTLSPDSALFATITAKPNNQTGNTVLYGHNTNQVLLPTKDLKIGDDLYLETEERVTFHYSYASDRFVKPDDTSVLSSTLSPQLTVITCNGLFNSFRRIMTFEFIAAEKNT